MKRKYIYIVFAVLIAFYLFKNFYSVTSFGSFEVIDKKKSGNQIELVVELKGEGIPRSVIIKDTTKVMYKEKAIAFTDEIWEKIAVNEKYQMDVEKNPFPISIFKGDYNLNLLYID